MSIEFTGERVIPGQVDSDLWNEHIARYVYASRLCAGARVLDAGTGAGYGCATLAEHAKLAIGFDIAADAIGFASQEYARGNTRWLQASLTSLPFATGAFDAVIAFEVIEHLADWQHLLIEARRVLVDGGVFLVSTPNKNFYAESRDQSGPNLYHQHEFECEEFQQALAGVFPHVHMLLENHAECILFDASNPAIPNAQAHIAGAGSPLNANFYLAICSTQPIEAPESFVYVPRAANILKERSDHIRRLEQELSTKDSWLANAQSEHADLVALHHTQTQELKDSNLWAQQLDAKWRAAADRVVELQKELDQQQEVALETARAYEDHLQQANRDLEARTQWARDLEAQARESREQLAKCVALLDRAEATVIERTEWANGLQTQIQTLDQVIAGLRASRWIKLGRTIGLGPELPS